MIKQVLWRIVNGVRLQLRRLWEQLISVQPPQRQVLLIGRGKLMPSVTGGCGNDTVFAWDTGVRVCALVKQAVLW